MPNPKSRWAHKQRPATARQSLVALGREVGSCIYAIRTDDGLIKIGFSQSVVARIRSLGGLDSVLALWPGGTYEEEQAIHRRLKPFRAKAYEYYHPVPTVLAAVEAVRAHSAH